MTLDDTILYSLEWVFLITIIELIVLIILDARRHSSVG
jgi:hypothetical protein